MGDYEKAERLANDARKGLKAKDRRLDSTRNLMAMSYWLVAKTYHTQVCFSFFDGLAFFVVNTIDNSTFFFVEAF